MRVMTRVMLLLATAAVITWPGPFDPLDDGHKGARAYRVGMLGAAIEAVSQAWSGSALSGRIDPGDVALLFEDGQHWFSVPPDHEAGAAVARDCTETSRNSQTVRDEFSFQWPAGERPASEIDIALPSCFPPRSPTASEPLPELLREVSSGAAAPASVEQPQQKLGPQPEIEDQVERIESLLRHLIGQTNAFAVRLDELEERLRADAVTGSAQAEVRLAGDIEKLIAIVEQAVKQQHQAVSEGASRDDLTFWVDVMARMASVQEATTNKLDDLLAVVLQRGRTLAAVPDRARQSGRA